MPNSSLPADLPADFGAAFAKLTAITKLEVEDMKLMILLETAGEPLYAAVADGVELEAAKKLLLQNGREETAHAHRLKRAIEILTGETYEIPPLADNPYAEAPAMGTIDADMLRGLIQAEFGGDAMYQGYAANEPNAEVTTLLLQNAREETLHGKRVEEVISLLAR